MIDTQDSKVIPHSFVRRLSKTFIKHTHYESSKRFFSSFFKCRRNRKPLTYRAYICFLVLLQMPLHYIMLLFDIALKYDCALSMGVYILFVIGVGLPLFMLFIFMGGYCKRGYFKYWQCVPLLKGAGYTIALMVILPEFMNSTSAGLSISYILDMFHADIPWKDCNFPKSTNCIVANMEKEIICTNLSYQDIPTFSALSYLRFNKENHDLNLKFTTLGPIKWDWAINTIIVWVLLFVMMAQGFLTFQRLMTAIQIIMVILWIVIYISTIVIRHSHIPRVDALYDGITPLFQVDFWIQIFMHVCDRVEPGNIILLNSLRDAMTLPIVDAIIIYSVKVIVVILLFSWLPILLQHISHSYSITDRECINMSGFEIVFAVVPDVLTKLPWPQMWITIWFIIIFVLSYSSTLYTYTGFVDSLTEVWPGLKIYRIQLCFLLCLISASVNLIFVTPAGNVLFYVWTRYGMLVLRMIVMGVITFALTFIYSLTRLINDYHFAYEEPPSAFWVQSWKVTPFLVLFETAFFLFEEDSNRESHLSRQMNEMLKLGSYIAACIMLLPMFSVMLWKYCKHVKQRMVTSITRPELGWGYFDLSRRLARMHFHPQKEIRYRTKKVKCRHHCLLNSDHLKHLSLEQSV